MDARDIKVALVRGYDYGPAYQEMVAELTRQGRLQLESDPMGVARLLKNGVVQATVMAPTILVGTLSAEDERVRELGPTSCAMNRCGRAALVEQWALPVQNRIERG